MLGDRLLTTPNGYALAAESSEVDALASEALVAAGDLAAALDLWRGEPYAGVPDAPDVLAARTRLTEIRLATLEDRLEADLALGRHAHLVAELAALVADHPTRQRLACLHLLALYRCGRATDALQSFQAPRTGWPASTPSNPATSSPHWPGRSSAAIPRSSGPGCSP